MQSPEQLKQRVLREKRLIARLRLASARVEETERERVWGIAAAHSAGLSIRKIAVATGLSSSRVHQLRHTDEACEIPEWLSRLAEPEVGADEQLMAEEPASTLAALQQRLADESEALRWCVDWLERLASSETVVVNLRAETDPKTAFVGYVRDTCKYAVRRIFAHMRSS